jgi:cobalt-precorrin 5A hydrolase
LNISILSFTNRADALAKRLSAGLERTPAHLRTFNGLNGRASLNELVGELWNTANALIFISAAGIAVRGIAPFTADKSRDPAVIAVTEDGKFAIPLLSGHIGGANKLAQTIAAIIGATAVISTATDLNGVFAFDTWAAEHNCEIANLTRLKNVSAALLRNERISLFTDYPISGKLPNGVVLSTDSFPEKRGTPTKSRKTAVEISIHNNLNNPPPTFDDALQLVPKIVCVGVGCRKNADANVVVSLVKTLLQTYNISCSAVEAIATVDLKSEEPALIALANEFRAPLITFSAVELAAMPGAFSSSEFVAKTVGVDNVCERAAMRFVTGGADEPSSNGSLLISKHAENGVTVAIAVRNWCIAFD